MISEEEMKTFLHDDLFNALKELFIGTVTWKAHLGNKDRNHMRLLGLSTNFLQARALYEFFYKPKECTPGQHVPLEFGTASAHHFVCLQNPSNDCSWKPQDVNKLYGNFMANGTPVQKREFHLVYGRSKKHGGTEDDESSHLKSRVLDFALDLLRLSKEFANCVRPEFLESTQSAIERALDEVPTLAIEYNIENPIP